MGCGGSKAGDLPLVIRCRERRELIRAANNHRYALAAAHVSYFRSLKDVGAALLKFVDEDLISTSATSFSISSPSLILSENDNAGDSLHLHKDEESHLHISDSSSSDDDGDSDGDYTHHHHAHNSHDPNNDDGTHHHQRHRLHIHKGKGFDHGVVNFDNIEVSSSNFSGGGVDEYGISIDLNVYYMKKSAPATKTVVQEATTPPAYRHLDSYRDSAADNSRDHGYGEVFTVSPQQKTLPLPSPKASAWDFLNVFDGGHGGLYSSGIYGYGSNSSSPDSSEVREKEGIPDLEEETEGEVYRSCEESEKPSMSMQYNGKGLKPSMLQQNGEGVKPSVSVAHGNGKSRIGQSDNRDTSSPKTLMPKSVDEVSVKKKGLNSEVERTSTEVVGSSNISVTMLSPNGTRDLREVMAEIRDDFEVASSYGKEVAMMLEVEKMPYQSGFLKVILSRILYLVAPSLMSRDSSSIQTMKLASRSVNLAKSYFKDVGKDNYAKVGSLSSTLDKLCAWEKKLYKEVKDEERLRIKYEKQCKRLRILGEVGAESGKILAAQASTRRLLTKLDVCIKAIDVISTRIHKLRDEELQPQVAALIYGLIRMWKATLNCHQKQIQAIMETKMQKFNVTTNPQTDPSSRAITKLERELRVWCRHFNDWIGVQKSYVESLNGWLLQCLQYEPEGIPAGPVPYSPLQLGAPPIFIICNDWCRAMEAISKGKVTNAMNAFATSLQKLQEKRDEEERRRLKSEYLLKHYEKLLRTNRMDRRKKERRQDTLSDKRLLIVPSDDVKLNLNTLRQRLAEERKKHKYAIKSVHAASRNLHGGLVSVFKALEKFSLDALEAHQHVSLQ